MKKCYDCTHVEMCGWRKEVKEQGCEFFSDGMVWIPVSEKLPKEGEEVLVTVSNEFGTFADVDSWTGGSFWTYIDEVTAWMPLPDPWKDGEEE